MDTIKIPHTVKLDYPITFGKDTIAELIFNRRLIAKDLKGKKAEDLKFDDFIDMIGALTGHPNTVIEKLDAMDFGACNRILSSFLSSGRKIGENQ